MSYHNFLAKQPVAVVALAVATGTSENFHKRESEPFAGRSASVK